MFQRMSDFAWRVSQAALALPLLVLFAAPGAIAQSDSGAQTARRMALEKRILDIADMFNNDPRYNRGKTREQIKDGVEFVTGNVLFVLAHETGHALISALEIPVAGREEDAADQLATVMALKVADSFADRVLVNAARGWFLGDQRDKKAGVPTIFYDEHGMDLQRAYHIVCLLVGGDPKKFKGLADEVKLPKQRQETCKFDWSNASWSWEQLLKPHLRKPADPKTPITVTYIPSAEFATLGELGQKLQILETVAEWLSDDFVWTKPISLEMRECGGPNARWIPGPRKIEICYELIREFVQLHRAWGQAELVPGTMSMSKNNKVVLSAKPSIRKSRPGKSFRSDRTRR
jgi:hypothetical protein